MRPVSLATAAASTEGFGKSPPKESKCRSGSQTEEKPCSSAKRAVAQTVSYARTVPPSSRPPSVPAPASSLCG